MESAPPEDWSLAAAAGDDCSLAAVDEFQTPDENAAASCHQKPAGAPDEPARADQKKTVHFSKCSKSSDCSTKQQKKTVRERNAASAALENIDDTFSSPESVSLSAFDFVPPSVLVQLQNVL
jgi:hypothetical protein